MNAIRLTGSRIREKRIDQGLRQASVAEAVGISPSYLNLIEHNRRRIGGKLLADLGRVLKVDPSLLAEGADVRLLDQMRQAAATLGDVAEVARAEEMAARFPGWAKLIASQADRIASLENRVQNLTDRMTFDPHLSASLHDVISAVTSIRSSASILVGQEKLDDDWQQRFHQNIHDDSLRLGKSSEALVTYLETPDREFAVVTTPLEEVELYLADNLIELQALEDQVADIATVVERSGLTHDAAKLLRQVATVYQRDAAQLPRSTFERQVKALNYDPIALSRHFNVGFATVLRRMASLIDDDGHPPMGLVVCDASGAVTFLKSITGFQMSRFGGACPLWPVFGAFARPGQPVRADVQLPGTVLTNLRCYAVADAVGAPAFDRPPALQSTMLVVSDVVEARADQIIPVGVSCRICPHNDCSSRREPAISGVGQHNTL